MANAKNTAAKTAKTKKVEKKEEVKEEVIKKEDNSEVIALKQQLEEMKKAMESLMNNKATEPSKIYVKEADNEVIIGCRILQGVGWGDPAKDEGEIRLRFNEEQTVTVSDMKKFFRQASIRKLFEDGICYFVNEEDYALFNIRKHIDLSGETLSSTYDLIIVDASLGTWKINNQTVKTTKTDSIIYQRTSDKKIKISK